MTDEIKKEEQQDPNAAEYIEAIQTLKANSVDQADYDKLKLENKQLLNALVEGKDLGTEENKPEAPSLEEIENKLFHGENNLTNLEYAQLSLQHRDMVLKQTHGKVDEYLPNGDKISPTEEDKKAAERVAEVLKQCIEDADGDSEVFTSALQLSMVDARPLIRRAGR